MKTIKITLYNINKLKTVNNAAYNKVLDNSRQFLIDDNFNYAAEDDVIDFINDNNYYYDINGIMY